MIQKDDEIRELIIQVQQLQLQQTALLARLAQARGDEAEVVAPDSSDTREADAPEQEVRAFAVGDRVRITNPNRALFQADRGVITKIGDVRITVQTRTGRITRAPKNLIFNNE
jgi:hypothetical protein